MADRYLQIISIKSLASNMFWVREASKEGWDVFGWML
jgi:hypothetical protein